MKLLFLLIVLGVIMVSRAEDCPMVTLNKCLALMNIDHLPSAVIPFYAQEVILDNCEQYRLFSKCMSLYVLKNCTVEMKLIYQGIDDSYTFLCNDGFEDYVRYQPCFAQSDVQKGASFCNNSFNLRRADLYEQHSDDTKYIIARTCQFVNDYIDCESNLLKSFCGEGAANWQRNFVSASWRPILYGNCPDWITPPTNTALDNATVKSLTTMPVEWVVIISLAIGICGVLIIIGIIFLACFKLRRNRSRRRDSWRTHTIDMPPPYPGPFILYPTEDDQITQEVCSGTVEVGGFKPPPYQTSLVSVPFDTGFQNDAYSSLNEDDVSILDPRMDVGGYDDMVDGGSSAGIAIGAVGGSPIPTAHFSQPSPPTMMSFHSSDGSAASSGEGSERFILSPHNDYY